MATHSSILAWRIPGTVAWWTAIYGVAQSQTRLTWLSSSSSSSIHQTAVISCSHPLWWALLKIQDSGPRWLRCISKEWFRWAQTLVSPHTQRKKKVLVTQSCMTICNPIDCSRVLFRQEYWNWLSFPSPGYLPDPGIKSGSPTVGTDSLPSEPPGKPTPP